MTLRIQLVKSQHATIISAYAPTLDAEDLVKEEFYSQLDSILSTVPKDDKIILLGDFNARVGRDRELWTGTIGKEGVGKVNANGTLLLTKCAEHNLVITNTLFRQKNRYKVSWQHPRSKQWHLIDYIIVRSRDQQDVLLTKAVTGADECWTDHRLIASTMKIKLRSKVKHHSKENRVKKFNIEALQDPRTRVAFQQCLLANLQNKNLDYHVEENWNQLKETIITTCEETIGRKKRKHQDWFDDNDETLKELIDQKRKAHIISQNDPKSATKRDFFKKCKAAVQRTTRTLKNQWWREKSREIQQLADANDTRGFFNATKEIYGPTTHGQAPLKSKDGTTILKSNTEIGDRWREHFDDLLNHKATIDKSILDMIPKEAKDYSLTRIPSLEEVKSAITTMKNNKAAGPDGIPAEIYKLGGDFVQHQLHQLLVKIWTNEAVPSDFRDANIITIYKRKGDRSECGNYRGISLLATAGKILARILNNRLKTLSERILPETQAGFRPSRSTTDMIFTLRQLQEKCREQHQPLYLAFIDLSKAFDRVSRELLWDFLAQYGCPDKFIRILRLLHDDMLARVLTNGGSSEPFKVTSGVKQGCVIAPTLFTIFIASVLHIIRDDLPPGIEISYRMDGKLFNLARLKSTSKTSARSLLEFQYADDNCVATHREDHLQQILNAFHHAYTKLGLSINIKKTHVLYQPPPHVRVDNPPSIQLEGTLLENVNHFCYLGSHLSAKVDISDEIQHRLKCAGTAFGKLRTRVFDDRDIRNETKIMVYRAVIIPTLLYASETWTPYSHHLKTLEKFHQRCLRKILNISWEDRKTNVSVLQEAKMTSIEAYVIKGQLRWSGHVVRMTDERLPKQIFYSQLKDGKRTKGGQKKRYKDSLKTNLKKCDIDFTNWEETAKNRPLWKTTIHEGTVTFESKRSAELEEKRRRRKERQQQPRPTLPSGTRCPHCDRSFQAKIGLISHLRTHQ